MDFNEFENEIFKNINVNNQMSLSCGQYGPQNSPQDAYLRSLKGVYFVSFFIDHPVVLGGEL